MNPHADRDHSEEPTPYICRHGKTRAEHYCDDHRDHAWAAIGTAQQEPTHDERLAALAGAGAAMNPEMAEKDATIAELRTEVERLRGPFPCCEHCKDDVVHDVEPGQHDLPCTLCDDPRKKAEAALARVEALADDESRHTIMRGFVNQNYVSVDDLAAALRGEGA